MGPVRREEQEEEIMIQRVPNILKPTFIDALKHFRRNRICDNCKHMKHLRHQKPFCDLDKIFTGEPCDKWESRYER